jgi:ABC-2 type transport system ATP-binding protein
MTDPAIRTENLTRSFGRLDAVQALDLEVPANSIYAFLGPNGAGKSTTLSILINALRPTSGKAYLLGRESTRLRAADFTRIGYVAEHQELPDWMTGAQTLAFLKPFYPNWDESFRVKLQETLDVPLARTVRDMSRGERMKLRLLSAMAYRPEVLILDEPFSGLDAAVREDLASGLLELVGEGNWTVVLASHDLDELERLVDHVGFIANGRMRFNESVEDLQSRFRKVTARFGSVPVLENLPDSWCRMEQEGGQIRFVDEFYDESSIRSELEGLGSLQSLDARPMSLREIFVATSRRERSVGKEAG